MPPNSERIENCRTCHHNRLGYFPTRLECSSKAIQVSKCLRTVKNGPSVGSLVKICDELSRNVKCGNQTFWANIGILVALLHSITWFFSSRGLSIPACRVCHRVPTSSSQPLALYSKPSQAKPSQCALFILLESGYGAPKSKDLILRNVLVNSMYLTRRLLSPLYSCQRSGRDLGISVTTDNHKSKRSYRYAMIASAILCMKGSAHLSYLALSIT
jgi:hypothetical protein